MAGPDDFNAAVVEAGPLLRDICQEHGLTFVLVMVPIGAVGDTWIVLVTNTDRPHAYAIMGAAVDDKAHRSPVQGHA